MTMNVNNMFELMQKAHNSIPMMISKRHFKYRMSSFTYQKLTSEVEKISTIKFRKSEISEFMGIKIEIDDYMPDFIFHLHTNFQIE